MTALSPIWIDTPELPVRGGRVIPIDHGYSFPGTAAADPEAEALGRILDRFLADLPGDEKEPPDSSQT